MGIVPGNATLLGIAALIASISGIVSTIVGARKSAKEAREKAEEECRERLKAARAEAEEAAFELHRIRMTQVDNPRNYTGERGEAPHEE